MRHNKLTLLLLIPMLTACAAAIGQTGDAGTTVRFATLNAAMGLAADGELLRRLQSGDDPGLQSLAEILRRVRPDVILLNEFDYRAGDLTARLLIDNYLSASAEGPEPIDYPYHFSGPVNTGVDSGLDIDGNGSLGDPGDAWGFGRFPGQYGMLVLSRFPIDTSSVRTFRKLLWRDMPDALVPVNADGSPFYPEDTWNQLRLSSKSHWDLPIAVNGTVVHLLASHPTPPVFDGPEDRNGRRNHDEIRLWADYVRPGAGAYLVDDQGGTGGLPEQARFVIAGDLNADPHDGDSTGQAILQLLTHERINHDCLPESAGGTEAARIQGGRNLEHAGPSSADTGDLNDERLGNLRIDYALPSAGLEVAGCGVFWPPAGSPGHDAARFSDHRLVWIDVVIPPE